MLTATFKSRYLTDAVNDDDDDHTRVNERAFAMIVGALGSSPFYSIHVCHSKNVWEEIPAWYSEKAMTNET